MEPRLNCHERALRQRARELSKTRIEAAASRIETELRCTRELLRELGAAGLLAPVADTDAEVLATVRMALVVEELARCSGAVATVVSGQWVVGLLLDRFGGSRQKNRLGGLANGDCMAANVGLSGAAFQPLRLSSEGCLQGEVALVPGAVSAELFLVAAHQEDAEDRTLMLVRATAAGVTVAAEQAKLGLNGSATAAVAFDDVDVTGAAGAEPIGAAGEAVVQHWEALWRLSQAAQGVGLAQAALDASLADVRQRSQTDAAADHSQAVQWMLADIATETQAARLSTWYAATQETGPALQEAAACARRAVQILGERGALRAAGVERVYRDAKMMEILAGTNEDQLRLVARHLMPDVG